MCAVTGRVDFSALSEFRKKVEKHLEETSAQTDELNPQSAHRALNPGSPFQPTPDGNALPKDLSKDATARFYLRVLEKELTEDGVTEIAFNNPASQTIFVEKYGRWEERPFRVTPRENEKGVRRMAEGERALPQEVQTQANYDFINSLSIAVAQFNSTDIKESSPILSATLPDGERVQFVRPPACMKDTISMTIRRPSMEVRTPESYEESGFYDELHEVSTVRAGSEELLDLYGRFFDEKLKPEELRQVRSDFMRRCVELGRTVVIAGSTGSGKTTYMKALMQYIPKTDRIITIEDCPELMYGLPNHKNQVNLLYPSEATAESPVNATKLMKSCLRMKPDRILLAELRGGETYDWVNSVLSGHSGSITSCHAANALAVFDYLAMKIRENPVGRSVPNVTELIKSVIDVIVHIQNNKGKRYITEVYFREFQESRT